MPDGEQILTYCTKELVHNPQLGAVLAGIGYGRSRLGQKKVTNGTLLSMYCVFQIVL